MQKPIWYCFVAGLLAGIICGLVAAWLFSRNLPVAYSYSALFCGLAGGLSAAAAVWIAGRLVGWRRAAVFVPAAWLGLATLTVLLYWGNKWLLAGIPFNARKSLLFDAGAVILSALCGAILRRFFAPILASGRGRLGITIVALVLPAAGLAAAILSSRGAGRPRAAGGRPSVILVSIDTMRADRAGCYGYDRPTTPGLDSLAATGVRFGSAYCPVPQSSPSHASMLTGLDVQSHGVRQNGFELVESIHTIAEAFAGAGYATGGFLANALLGRRFGFHQGFDVYVESGHVEVLESITAGLLERTLAFREGLDLIRYRFFGGEDQTLSAAKAWLGSLGDRPFFLFFHLIDPHTPYEPLGRFRTMFPPDEDRVADGEWIDEGLSRRTVAVRESRYDGEVAQADWKVRELLGYVRKIGRDRNLLVVITSDHGENLGDHAPFFRHARVYESVLHVPLVFSFPQELPAGRVVRSPVENFDIVPTVLALAGISPPAEMTGRDLTPLMTGEEKGNGERIIVGNHGRMFSLREGRYKIIFDSVGGTCRLFDLSVDEGERSDLAAEEPEVMEAMRGKLAGYIAERGAVDLDGDEGVKKMQQTGRETRQRLRALGYLD